MKILNSFETRCVSGGRVILTTQESVIDVILTNSSDNFAIGYGFGVGGTGNTGLLFKGDGKVFLNNIYIETSPTARNIYTPLEYFSISSNLTETGWHFVIGPAI